MFFPVAYGRAHGCGHDAATSQFSEHATTPPPHEGFLPQKNIVHYREVLVKEIIKAFRINESVLEAFRKLSSIIVLMNVSRSSERVPNSHIHGLQGTTNEIGEIERQKKNTLEKGSKRKPLYCSSSNHLAYLATENKQDLIRSC